MTTTQQPTTDPSSIVFPAVVLDVRWRCRPMTTPGSQPIHDSAVAYFGDEIGNCEGGSVALEADPTGADPTLWPPRVTVWAGIGELTPADARRLAAHLLTRAWTVPSRPRVTCHDDLCSDFRTRRTRPRR